MTTLHINGWTPPAISVAIALREKNVAFDLVEHRWQDTAIALRTLGGQLETYNSLEGEFPLLVEDGLAMNDSYFILEYLDDRYPSSPLKPAHAFGQWQLQALARFFGERALPAVSSLGVASAFAGKSWPIDAMADLASLGVERQEAWIAALTDPANPAIEEESGRKVGLLFERLESLLAGHAQDWLLGSQFTLADIEAFVLVDPFVSGRLPPVVARSSELLRDWHERVSGRPSVAATLAQIEPTFLPGPEHARWG